jgi:hypothetical protein
VTAALREHLLASRIAGDVATPRESNVGNIGRLLAGEPYAWLGITPLRDYSFDDLLAIMVARCGIGADPAYAEGADTIDVDLTIEALDAMGRRLAKAAQARERVFVATGHPSGILAIHMPVAAALAEAGCELLTPDAGRWVELEHHRRNPALRRVGLRGVVRRRPQPHALRDPDGRAARDGLQPTWSSPTTGGPARPDRPASTPSASPTATTRRCSSGSRRASSTSSCRWTTTSSRTSTSRSPSTCSGCCADRGSVRWQIDLHPACHARDLICSLQLGRRAGVGGRPADSRPTDIGPFSGYAAVTGVLYNHRRHECGLWSPVGKPAGRALV